MPKMNPEVKAKWVAALRSGEYKQGFHALRKQDSFCCLGVLCNLHAQANPDFAATQFDPRRYDGSSIWPSDTVLRWAGIDLSSELCVSIAGVSDALAAHNDGCRTFAEIADAIEEQL